MLPTFRYYWSTWYVGNALACLTVGPIILTWMDRGPALASYSMSKRIEAALLVLLLLLLWVVSLQIATRMEDISFEPAILYLPLSVLLWTAIRFGERGAAVSILVLTIVSVWLTLNGHGPFATDSPEKSVLALQLFLFGVAVPILLLFGRCRSAPRRRPHNAQPCRQPAQRPGRRASPHCERTARHDRPEPGCGTPARQRLIGRVLRAKLADDGEDRGPPQRIDQRASKSSLISFTRRSLRLAVWLPRPRAT